MACQVGRAFFALVGLALVGAEEWNLGTLPKNGGGNQRSMTASVCDRTGTGYSPFATGIITSPSYPGQYHNNADCEYYLKIQEGSRINVTFLDFVVEEHSTCLYDYVEIRDGHGKWTLCGGKTPTSILSARNKVWIRFVTDGSISNKGFKLEYTTVAPQTSGYHLIETPRVRCTNHIETLSECSEAAQQLGLFDTKATIDGQIRSRADPPYCYYEGGRLKFNQGGSNTGSCGSWDLCLCRTRPQDYLLVENPGVPCNNITTLSECQEAAQQLGLYDTTVDYLNDNWTYGSSFYPPYCYYTSNHLKFNPSGLNRGSCYSNGKCLCHPVSP